MLQKYSSPALLFLTPPLVYILSCCVGGMGRRERGWRRKRLVGTGKINPHTAGSRDSGTWGPGTILHFQPSFLTPMALNLLRSGPALGRKTFASAVQLCTSQVLNMLPLYLLFLPRFSPSSGPYPHTPPNFQSSCFFLSPSALILSSGLRVCLHQTWQHSWQAGARERHPHSEEAWLRSLRLNAGFTLCCTSRYLVSCPAPTAWPSNGATTGGIPTG